MSQQKWIERLVHYQCLEPLLMERDVLEIGCGTGRAADHISSLARKVTAIDTSSLVLTQARRHHLKSNLAFHVLEPDRMNFRSHAFDLVLVPELQRWVTRGQLVPEIQRVLKPDGFAVFGVPSADAGHEHGLGYVDLLEYLTEAFEYVRLLGEIPFAGTIVADFEPDEELEPALDCTLIDEDEAPSSYLAICGQSNVPPIGYTVIQVPRYDEDEVNTEVVRLQQIAQQAESRAEEWANKVEVISRKLVERGEDLEAANVEIQQLKGAISLADAADLELDVDLDLLAEHMKLKEECDGLRLQIRELEHYRSERRAEEVDPSIEELREKLAEAERRVLEASTNGRAELTAARRELRVKNDRIEELEEALALAENLETIGDPTELESYKQECADLGAKIAELEVELARQDGNAPSESSQNALAERLSQQIEAERKRAQVEADTLKRQRDDYQQRVDREKSRVKIAEERSEALGSEVDKAGDELTTLHQRIAELEALRQSERWRIDELSGRLREAEAKEKEDNELASEWAYVPTQTDDESRLQKLEAQRAAEERRALVAEKKAAELQALLDEEDLELEAGQSIKRSKNEIALRSDLGRAQERILQLEKRCDELVTYSEKIAKEAEEAQQTLRKVTTSPEDEDATIESLKLQLKEAKSEVERVKQIENELEHARQVAMELQATQTQLRDAEQAVTGLVESRTELVEICKKLRENTNDVDGDESDTKGAFDAELFEIREAQLETLLEGAARHKKEAESLKERLEELDEFVIELKENNDKLENNLVEAIKRADSEEEKAKSYQDELGEVGRKLAMLEGELIKLRQSAG